MMFLTMTKAQVLMLIMKKKNHTNLTTVILAEMILGMPWIVESKRGPKKAFLTFIGLIGVAILNKIYNASKDERTISEFDKF